MAIELEPLHGMADGLVGRGNALFERIEHGDRPDEVFGICVRDPVVASWQLPVGLQPFRSERAVAAVGSGREIIALCSGTFHRLDPAKAPPDCVVNLESMLAVIQHALRTSLLVCEEVAQGIREERGIRRGDGRRQPFQRIDSAVQEFLVAQALGGSRTTTRRHMGPAPKRAVTAGLDARVGERRPGPTMPRPDELERQPEDVLIEAVLDAAGRRTSPVFLFGPFRLDVGDQRLFHHETPVPLPPKEFDTLRLLVERHGRLITKQELLATVWGGTCVDEGTIAQRICSLRRALGRADHGGPYIETVPRRGYRFVASVSESFR